MKTTYGQILVGVGAFIIIMSANTMYFLKKEEPLRLLVFVNILLVLFISCVLSDNYFKRPDIALYIAGSSLLFVGIFIVFELSLKKKINK